MILRLILAVTIVLMPNISRFDVETGIPGLNVANIVLLVVFIAVALSKEREPYVAATGELTPALCGFLIVLLISFAVARSTSGNMTNDFLYLKNAIFYPLFYFVFRRCRQDLKSTRQLIILTMIVAVFAGVQAVRQGIDYGIGQFDESRRASGPFGDSYAMANLAGVYYAMFLPMFVALALFLRGQRLWRLAAIAAIVILVTAIMVTYSRQSYLIAVVCVTLLLARRSMILAVIISVAMVGAIGVLPNSVTQRVVETKQTDAVGTAKLDTSTASRFEIWKGGMRMWQDHPMGVGLGRFSMNIGEYAPAYAKLDAHNFYVKTLAESGPLGVIALMWVLWRLIRLAMVVQRSARADDSEARALALGFGVCVLALMMGNLYGSRFFDGALMASFWMLCGLMERYAALQRHAGGNAQPDPSMLAGSAPTLGERFPLAARALPGRHARSASRL